MLFFASLPARPPLLSLTQCIFIFSPCLTVKKVRYGGWWWRRGGSLISPTPKTMPRKRNPYDIRASVGCVLSYSVEELVATHRQHNTTRPSTTTQHNTTRPLKQLRRLFLFYPDKIKRYIYVFAHTSNL